MANWSLRIKTALADPIEDGSKTDELRLGDASSPAIREMKQYQPEDTLRFQLANDTSIITEITRQTTIKLLGDLTQEEVDAIVGSFRPGATRDQLIAFMNGIYHFRVDEGTEAHIAHFALV